LRVRTVEDELEDTQDDLPSKQERYNPSPKIERTIKDLLIADARQKARTYSYYQELRKTNPIAYLDRKTALQMEKDSQALGDAFFDTEDE
jgi:hypothetical protein